MSQPIQIPVREANASEMPVQLPVDDAMRLFILETAASADEQYCWC